MARPREVRDTFQTLIEQNRTVISGIEVTMSRTADLRDEVGDVFKRQLESVAQRLMRGPDREALAVLASISGEKNIATAYDEAVAASENARAEYDAYVEKHGNTVELNSKLQEKTRELADINLKASVVEDALDGIKSDLSKAKIFMKDYPEKKAWKPPKT